MQVWPKLLGLNPYSLSADSFRSAAGVGHSDAGIVYEDVKRSSWIRLYVDGVGEAAKGLVEQQQGALQRLINGVVCSNLDTVHYVQVGVKTRRTAFLRLSFVVPLGNLDCPGPPENGSIQTQYQPPQNCGEAIVLRISHTRFLGRVFPSARKRPWDPRRVLPTGTTSRLRHVEYGGIGRAGAGAARGGCGMSDDSGRGHGVSRAAAHPASPSARLQVSCPLVRCARPSGFPLGEGG